MEKKLSKGFKVLCKSKLIVILNVIPKEMVEISMIRSFIGKEWEIYLKIHCRGKKIVCDMERRSKLNTASVHITTCNL